MTPRPPSRPASPWLPTRRRENRLSSPGGDSHVGSRKRLKITHRKRQHGQVKDRSGLAVLVADVQVVRDASDAPPVSKQTEDLASKPCWVTMEVPSDPPGVTPTNSADSRAGRQRPSSSASGKAVAAPNG
jgi:hypothetical protein